jgi:hypothetical protein
MRHRRWRLGGRHNFMGGSGGFRANHIQVRRSWRAVCIYRRRPTSMPYHGSAEEVVLPSQLCVRRLGSCASGGDDRGGQGVWCDEFLVGAGAIIVIGAGEWSIRLRFTGRL